MEQETQHEISNAMKHLVALVGLVNEFLGISIDSTPLLATAGVEIGLTRNLPTTLI